MPQIPLATKSDPGRSKAQSAERLVNMFAEEHQGGKYPFALYAAPGLVEFAEPSDAPCRGLIEVGDYVIAVHESSVVKVLEDGSFTRVGTFPGVDKVIMARNDYKDTRVLTGIEVVSGGTGHVVGDILTLDGGSFDTPATVKVESLNGSGVASASIVAAGSYSVVPSNSVQTDTSTGSGTGATFSATWTVGGNENPQVAIVGAVGLYVYQSGATSPIVNEAVVNPVSVEYLDGYIIVALESGRFLWTAINDATDIDGLDFATAEGSPDKLKRGIRFRRELWLLGEQSTEIWANTGEADAPFKRVPGAVLDIGCASSFAVARVGTSLYWVDHLRIVRQVSSGYQPVRVSNVGLERALSDLTDLTTLEMFGWVEGGHEFVAVRCPTFCWIYDSNTGSWSERETYLYTTWQAQSYVRAFGKHLVGSSISGKIYQLSTDAMDEDGTVIVCKAVLPTVAAFPMGGTHMSLDLDIESGTGVSTGDDSDVNPEIMLRWSLDNGSTFVGGARRYIGAIGQRNETVSFSRLGAFGRQGVAFEISCSAKVVRAFLAANMDAQAKRA